MKKNYIIIGGGVAGLSAANCLAKAGAEVVLLEAGSWPAHKICGEFISPEALPLLQDWGLPPPTAIDKIRFIDEKKTLFSMKLPQMAASYSRYYLDKALSDTAKKLGVHIVNQAFVDHIDVPKIDREPFTVRLQTGEEWQASSLLLSTGRLLNKLTQTPTTNYCYVGAKAHFSGIALDRELLMYLMKKSYFGVCPIGHNKVNVAGLIACSPEEALHPKQTLAKFFTHPSFDPLIKFLDQGCCDFDGWMAAPVPSFGLRKTPCWPKTYFLGDAAGVIPPATGDGLAMGLTSGVLAAKYALLNEPENYKKRWQQIYRARIQRGVMLHKLFLSPWASSLASWVSHLLPSLPCYLFHLTRGK